jgi:DNA-binding IclR family transcriptional regulator
MEQNRPPGIARLAVPFFHPSNGNLGGTLSVVTEAPRLTRAATVEWAKIIHSHVTAIERALAMDSVG